MKKKKSDKDMLSKQEWELAYLKKTYGVTKVNALKAIAAVGNSRRKIMAYLRDNNLIKESEQVLKNTG